ncbi:MAG TPA: hypothetical protein P5230_02565 [Candidatus Magasanikbacteria bacterium]|nr:hypothetical protein [Candidatus Magasanikbacteria bacterium]
MKKIFLLIFALSFLFSTAVLAANENTIKLTNPLKINLDSPAEIIGYVIKAVLGIIGGVALVMMVYGGFQWLTAAGNEDKIKSGTQTMIWAAIGLIFVFSSYLITATIFQVF